MGITEDNVTIPHPIDPDRYLIFVYDIVHKVKNTWTHSIDDDIKFEDGTRTSPKKDLYQLKSKLNSADVSINFNLKDIHIEAKKSERQNVSYARHVLSTECAVMLRKFFPEDHAKLLLADFFQNMDETFKILTSKMIYNYKDPMKNALRIEFEKQESILMKTIDYMQTIKFINKEGTGKHPFMKGIIITIRGVLLLHKLLKTEYDIPYLLTTTTNQCWVERGFGELR